MSAEFKKTTTVTSCRTPPNNSVNEQNKERAKYNLVGFSAVLCKTKGYFSNDNGDGNENVTCKCNLGKLLLLRNYSNSFIVGEECGK